MKVEKVRFFPIVAVADPALLHAVTVLWRKDGTVTFYPASAVPEEFWKEIDGLGELLQHEARELGAAREYRAGRVSPN